MSIATTTLVALISSFGLQPTDDVAADRVDLIEVNHLYDDQGRHNFDQLIFYDWSASQGRYNIRAWRLLKHPTQFPYRDWQRGEFIAVWHDGQVLRQVRAATLRESWTQYDPEVADRAYLPKEQRRELQR